jgi:hypothetical protein
MAIALARNRRTSAAGNEDISNCVAHELRARNLHAGSPLPIEATVALIGPADLAPTRGTDNHATSQRTGMDRASSACPSKPLGAGSQGLAGPATAIRPRSPCGGGCWQRLGP